MIALGQVYFTSGDPISNLEIYIPYPIYYKIDTVPYIRLWESSDWNRKSLAVSQVAVFYPAESKNTYNGLDFTKGTFLVSESLQFNSKFCNIYIVYKLH